jgi:hypothetical protein
MPHCRLTLLARPEGRYAARHTDTAVKARYSRGVRAAIRLAKDHVRNAVHHPDEQGQRQYRELWDRDGRISKQAAYTRLDDVEQPDYTYRLTLSPHPERQDPSHRLDLHAWTRGMMRQLEQRAGQELAWIAATHEHPDPSPPSWRGGERAPAGRA